MLRIGLSGTNWTRKTTTIEHLTRDWSSGTVDVVSLSALVRQCPYPMGPDQGLEGSKWMVEQVGRILDEDVPADVVQVFDRTPLDILSFTSYATDRTGSPDNALIETIQSLITKFTFVFYCRPLGEWPDPISPSPEMLDFALTIDALLSRFAGEWPSRVIELPWSVEARVDRISELVSDCRERNESLAE